MTTATSKGLPTPGVLFVHAWPCSALKGQLDCPTVVAIPAAALEHLQTLASWLHPSMRDASFEGEHGCAGARVLYAKSKADEMYAATGEPMEWPDDAVWVGPNGVEYVPYYPIGSLEHDYLAPAAVRVEQGPSFQLFWPAIDLGEDCLIESEPFTLRELAWVRDLPALLD